MLQHSVPTTAAGVAGGAMADHVEIALHVLRTYRCVVVLFIERLYKDD